LEIEIKVIVRKDIIMGIYVVREAEEYYDMDACDARGNPVKRIRYTGVEYETTVDPDGDYVEMGPNGWEIHTVIK
jgi:hypothetical protein